MGEKTLREQRQAELDTLTAAMRELNERRNELEAEIAALEQNGGPVQLARADLRRVAEDMTRKLAAQEILGAVNAELARAAVQHKLKAAQVNQVHGQAWSGQAYCEQLQAELDAQQGVFARLEQEAAVKLAQARAGRARAEKELAEARWQKAAGVPDLPVESG